MYCNDSYNYNRAMANQMMQGKPYDNVNQQMMSNQHHKTAHKQQPVYPVQPTAYGKSMLPMQAVSPNQQAGQFYAQPAMDNTAMGISPTLAGQMSGTTVGMPTAGPFPIAAAQMGASPMVGTMAPDMAALPPGTAPIDFDQLLQTPILDIEYTQGYLRTQIGRKVKIEFLIGTNMLIDRDGTLMDVGVSYVIIQETETDDLLLCDIYSIKFIRFYF